MKLVLHSFFLAVFTLLIACSSSTTPEKTVEEFYKNIASKNFDKALTMIYFGDLDDAQMTKAKGKANMMLTSFYANMEKAGGFKSVEIKEVKLSDDGKKARVMHVVHMDKRSKNENINLINDNGIWKITLKR